MTDALKVSPAEILAFWRAAGRERWYARDDAFDADLRARHPAWGLRQLDAVAAQAAVVGLRLRERVAMPANNLLLALERGFEVIYVSNHGGRQLDHAEAAIETLREVVDVVAGQAEIVVDGGFTIQ